MEGVLTEATRTAAKKGFGAPVGPWLRNEATHLLDDLTDATADWIPPKLLKRCIQEHRAGTADHRRRLWSALILARWRTGPHGCG
jgi:asparagine synthase (glutamine-hydrolysing)